MRRVISNVYISEAGSLKFRKSALRARSSDELLDDQRPPKRNGLVRGLSDLRCPLPLSHIADGPG